MFNYCEFMSQLTAHADSKREISKYFNIPVNAVQWWDKCVSKWYRHVSQHWSHPGPHCFILKHSPDVVLDLAVQQNKCVCVSVGL